MPRPQRIEFEGAWYLIENQGYDGNQIFEATEDAQIFKDLLEEITSIFGIEIYAYALLDDRFYLVIHTPKAQLSRAMRHLNGIYTQRYNKAHDYEGPVFAGRFHSLVFDPAQYLTDMVVYVNSRCVEFGLSPKASDYPHCSHPAYMRERERPTWLHCEKVTAGLGFIKALANAKFNRMVTQGPSQSFVDLLENERSILGNKDFKEQVRYHGLMQDKRTQKKSKTQTQSTAQEILDFVASAYEVPVKQIKSSQSGVSNEARNMAVYQLRQVGGFPQKEIARVLNSSNPYTVAKVLQRFNERIETDVELAELAKEISDDLRQRVS